MIEKNCTGKVSEGKKSKSKFLSAGKRRIVRGGNGTNG